MNTILEQINSAGFKFVEFALPMLVQSTLLIVVLLLIDLLLRKKVRAVVRYWLWMLVLLKLVLPTTLSSPVSLGSWLGDELASIKVSDTSIVEQPANLSQPAETRTPPAAVEPAAIAATTVTSPPDIEPISAKAVVLTTVSPMTLTWQGISFLIWIAVVTAMGLLLLQRAIFVNDLLTQAKQPTELMKDTFRFCCTQMKLKGKVGLKVSANTASPAVCGLFRPVILVPENLAPTLGAGHLRTVLLHELAHIKRADLWINLAQTILQIMYFYNPLLWLANSVIRRIREQAVDEAVQVAMGTKARQYPQTLIDVAKTALSRPALSLRLIGVVESKSALKGRIKRMLTRPIPKSAKLGILGLVTLLIFAAVLLPMAKAEFKPPGFLIKGTVTDADTGQPIAGAKVGDEQYVGGKQWATTDANGHYSYLTWYEEHNIKCEAPGYKYKQKSLYTKFLGSEKEKDINFTLEPSDISANLDYSSATVEEGVGFDDIIVGNTKCTGEFIKLKLGPPDKEVKNEKDWWLNYRKTYGLGFWVNPQENLLIEIRLNKGFKGKLDSGISVSSTKEEVFQTYGWPVEEKTVSSLHGVYNDKVLYKRRFTFGQYSKIHYDQHGLLFHFVLGKAHQICVYRKAPNQQGSEHNFKTTPPVDISPEDFGYYEQPGNRKKEADINAKKKQIAEKLVTLTEQRDRIQRDLDAAERALGEVRDRWGINDLEGNSYSHPIIERFNRLQKEQDDCALEINQFEARIENLKREKNPNSEEIKNVGNRLTELKAKFDMLEKMRAEAEARWRELNLARIQYKQRANIRDERLQRLNELKSQIEKYRLIYDNPKAFDVQIDFKEISEVSVPSRPTEPKQQLQRKVYDISDLTKNQADVIHLTMLIPNTVEPNTWYRNGGTGKATIAVYSGKLIIYQTPEIHKKIQDLLEDLRNSKTGDARN